MENESRVPFKRGDIVEYIDPQLGDTSGPVQELIGFHGIVVGEKYTNAGGVLVQWVTQTYLGTAIGHRPEYLKKIGEAELCDPEP